MGREVLEQRDKDARDRAILKVWTIEFAKISPDIFSISTRAKKASSTTKRKALEVVEQGPKKKLRLECNGKEREVGIEALKTCTRSGRTVKKTSKAVNGA